MANEDTIGATIAQLCECDLDELRNRWAGLYGVVPAPRISRNVLIRGVSYRVQEETLGGLGKSCRRQLLRLAEALRDGGAIPASQGQSFKAGTKLIREWKGEVHEVVIVGDGYVWGGNRYRSLSEIARAITGTRWSGPRFFGLEAGQEAARVAAATVARSMGSAHG